MVICRLPTLIVTLGTCRYSAVSSYIHRVAAYFALPPEWRAMMIARAPPRPQLLRDPLGVCSACHRCAFDSAHSSKPVGRPFCHWRSLESAPYWHQCPRRTPSILRVARWPVLPELSMAPWGEWRSISLVGPSRDCCVLGARLIGGYGTLTGTLLGVSLIVLVENSLIVIGIPSTCSLSQRSADSAWNRFASMAGQACCSQIGVGRRWG